jgi:hypothetical protein
MAIGATAGAIFGACTYETALAGKCGCDVQKQVTLMTNSEWVKMNALSGALITGYSVALATAQPVGPIILGGSMIYIGVSDLIPAIKEINKVGITTCMVTRIFLDVAGIAFGTIGIVKGIHAWRTSGNELS